jgi:hypothetical protein
VNSRRALARRYRYLWRGELVAAGGFLLAFVVYVPLERPWPDWILRASGLFILLVLLVEGAFWWRGRLSDLEALRRQPSSSTLQAFRILRTANWLLIAIFPALVAWRMTWSRPPPAADPRWGIALAVGALLEQVNYFHYQLSYGYGLDFWYLRRYRRLRRGHVSLHLSRADLT